MDARVSSFKLFGDVEAVYELYEFVVIPKIYAFTDTSPLGNPHTPKQSPLLHRAQLSMNISLGYSRVFSLST